MDPQRCKEQFQQLLGRPDAELPLERMCYLICQLAGEEVDMALEMRKHDVLAGLLTPTFAGIISGLFGPTGPIRGNSQDYYNFENSLLTRLRANGRGLPITLCVQALVYGERLDVPMAGVGMPGHFLLRSTSEPDLFADPFHGDQTFDASTARRLFERLTGGGVAWQDSFLDPVSSRNILYRILNNLHVSATKHAQWRHHLPWILELSSWFSQGRTFDSATAARLMAPYN